MKAEHVKTERAIKLLLEHFPEYSRSEGRSGAVLPQALEDAEPSLLVALAHTPVEHGIPELNSPLAE